MIRIQSENELLQMFRPIDRDQVRVPSDFQFPVAVVDYLAWVEPSGHRTFLVYEDQASHDGRGVVFRRSHPPAEPVTNMCEWCHSVSGSGTIGLLSVSVNAKRRVGLNLCRGLECKANVEAEPPGLHDLRESLSIGEKTSRIMTRMTEFARRNLF